VRAKCLLIGASCIFLFEAQTASSQTRLETQAQTNEKIRNLSSSAPSVPHDYIIGRGDLIGVEVFEVPELTREVRVSQTGTIGLPLVPVRLYVSGLTEIQVQQKITEVLEANGLISHPQVMVAVKDRKSQPITIVGAVAHPMVYQADRPVTLVQVLAEAGGVSADAGDTVIITRPDPSAGPDNPSEPPEIGVEEAVPATNPTSSPATEEQPNEVKGAGSPPTSVFPGPDKVTAPPSENAGATPPPISSSNEPPPIVNTITVNLSELLERGDTQGNVPLKGGDIVTVPHAGIVYALGAVTRPGGYVSTNDRAQLSTLKVLALAGGMTRVAKKDRAVIIRKDALGKQQEIPLDLRKILERKSEDVRLMPSDILYVPDNAAKAVLIRSAEIALIIGTALTIYRLQN
jgi:protein involved in polysaccharide export with SLBB domain